MKAAIAAAVVLAGVELNKWVQARGGWTKVYAAFKQGNVPAVLALPVTNTTSLIGGATGTVANPPGLVPPVIQIVSPAEAKALQPWQGLIPTLQQGAKNIGTWFTGPAAQAAPAVQPIGQDIEPVYRDPIDDLAKIVEMDTNTQIANQWAYIETLASS